MENLLTDSEYSFRKLLHSMAGESFLCSEKMNDKKLLVTILNQKSKCYLKHSKRVSTFATKLAKQLHLDKHLIKQIKLAALLHDIGKLGISEQLLNSPNKLTEAEFQLMKEHSKIGCCLLYTSSKLKDVSKFVLEHHERYDGSGYPIGLLGDNISLPARIITIADSYDAMTSERSYKNTLTKEEAVEEFKRCAGSQFDPELVDIFIKKVLK